MIMRQGGGCGSDFNRLLNGWLGFSSFLFLGVGQGLVIGVFEAGIDIGELK